MDNTPIGVDLTREPVVTEVEGGRMLTWPGCRAFVPGPLGEARPTSAMPNAAEGLHGANPDPVEALLDRFWPQLESVTAAKELGAVILAAGVDVKMKRPLALAARDRLGAEWGDGTVRHWLKPSVQTIAWEEKRRKVSRKASVVWYAKNKDRARQAMRAWGQANKVYRNGYQNARRQEPVIALTHRLRNRLAKAVQAAGAGKAGKTLDLVGCSVEFLHAHITSQFVDGMSWETRKLWHVDHIRPLSSYDLTDPAQQAESMHWTNLRPMWGSDNIAKSSWHEGKRHRYRKLE